MPRGASFEHIPDARHWDFIEVTALTAVRGVRCALHCAPETRIGGKTMRPMKIAEAVRRAFTIAAVVIATAVIATILIPARVLLAQDTPMGDVARQTRAQKSQASHVNKVVTNEDLGPQLTPVAETDDPAQVVNKARRAWVADTPRTCRRDITNNSGPGSSVDDLMEIAGSDHQHMLVNRRGADSGRSELYIIGTDIYSRTGAGAWSKTSTESSPTGTPQFNQLPEALMGDYASGELRLVGRDAIAGVPTFLYETKFHPGGVEFRDRTMDFWIGANDNLLRKVDTLTKETGPSGGGIETRDTTTCSYGSVPEIKPPI